MLTWPGSSKSQVCIVRESVDELEAVKTFVVAIAYTFFPLKCLKVRINTN